jgi:hypothetical protein
MNKILFLCFILFLCQCKNANTQNKTISYQKYRIENFGSIDIPSNLELEQGEFKEMTENAHQSLYDKYKYTLPSDLFVFHQVGLNEKDDEAYSTYVRLMYTKTKGKKGEYQNLNTLDLSPNDLIIISEDFRKQAVNNLAKANTISKGVNLKMLEWYGIQIVTINGSKFLKYSLRRTPDTYVCVYNYFDSEYLYQFNIAYKMKYKATWKPIFEKVMNSVTISQTVFNNTPQVQDGWQKIYMKNVGSFDLPPTLEIQEGKYKQEMDSFYNRIEYAVPQLVAQPKGINNYKQESLEKYARVMLETKIGTSGDFLKLGFNISEFSEADIVDLNSTYKQQIQQGLTKISHKLITWYPLKIEKINGMSCMHLSFIRQLDDNPIVLINMYIFQNNDRVHTLTLSYRLKEKENWENDFKSILKSFRITNIK